MSSAPLYRDFTSAEQIDWEYKPSLRIADAEQCMRRYGEHSAEARTRLDGSYDIAYGPTRDEKLDIFPAARPNAPLFVFIHGGYWRAFSAREHSFVALGPVALGITTVLVDYSLCPKVTIDEITRQCRAAIAWTIRHIGEYGGDPARVAVGGHSAGGHLSAMCLETRWDEDWGLVPIRSRRRCWSAASTTSSRCATASCSRRSSSTTASSSATRRSSACGRARRRCS